MHTWKLTSEDTGGAFFLFEDVMAPRKATPLHRHPEADETLYVVEGEIVVNIAGEESRVGAGGMTFTPKGVPHAFLVVSDGARLLTVQTPGIGQTFYRSASEPTTGDACETVDIPRVQRRRTSILAPYSSSGRRPSSTSRPTDATSAPRPGARTRRLTR